MYVMYIQYQWIQNGGLHLFFNPHKDIKWKCVTSRIKYIIKNKIQNGVTLQLKHQCMTDHRDQTVYTLLSKYVIKTKTSINLGKGIQAWNKI